MSRAFLQIFCMDIRPIINLARPQYLTTFSQCKSSCNYSLKEDTTCQCGQDLNLSFYLCKHFKNNDVDLFSCFNMIVELIKNQLVNHWTWKLDHSGHLCRPASCLPSRIHWSRNQAQLRQYSYWLMLVSWRAGHQSHTKTKWQSLS